MSRIGGESVVVDYLTGSTDRHFEEADEVRRVFAASNPSVTIHDVVRSGSIWFPDGKRPAWVVVYEQPVEIKLEIGGHEFVDALTRARDGERRSSSVDDDKGDQS